MGHTNDYLNTIRGKIAAADTVLAEARERLSLVREIAMDFPGALRTYPSGSLAQFTVNHPVTDGDGGLVLNRIHYPHLGPEGGGETPSDIADELCALLGPEIREVYPKARCGKSKRGPKITFGEPINGQDPSVDLVVALTRREGSGLWIPNLDMRRWEASDPEQHVALLNGGTESLRRTRRRAVRLLKAWNKQWSLPAFSSFHLSAMALEYIVAGMGLAAALHAVFDGGATFLATGCNTPDPAQVSKPLKLVNGISREVAVQRLRAAATAMADAIEHDDDETKVQSALHRVFRNYVDAPAEDKLASAVAALRTSRPVSTVALGLGGTAAAVAPTRAYGGHRPQ
jgi:hypothetical protein